MTKLVFSVCSLLTLWTAPLAAQVEVGGVQLRFNGLIHVQFSTSSVSSEDFAGGAAPRVPTSAFEARRVRLGVDVKANDWLFGKIEPEFAPGRIKLADLWADLLLHRSLGLRIGQFKKTFGLIEMTGDAKLVLIERGVRIRGLQESLQSAEARDNTRYVYLLNGAGVIGDAYTQQSANGYTGRDFGAAVHGRLGVLDYEAGVFNGAGQDNTEDNEAKTLTARTRLKLPHAPLTFAAGVSSHDVIVSNETKRGTAWEADVEWGDFRHPGVNAMFEVSTGDNIAADDRFVGVHGIAWYYKPLRTGRRLEGVEVGGRVSWGDPVRSADDDAGVLFTPLLNLYFSGRNRLMVNWDFYRPQAAALDMQNALRAEIQIAF